MDTEEGTVHWIWSSKNTDKLSSAHVTHDLTHIRCSYVWKGRLREESKITSLVWTTESLVNSVTKFESERKQMVSSQSCPARRQAEI